MWVNTFTHSDESENNVSKHVDVGRQGVLAGWHGRVGGGTHLKIYTAGNSHWQKHIILLTDMVCYYSGLCQRATLPWRPAGMWDHLSLHMSPSHFSHIYFFFVLFLGLLSLFYKPLPPVSPASHAALSTYLHLFLLQSSAFSFLVFLFQPEISTLIPFICIFYHNFQSSYFFGGETLTLHAALKYVFTAWQSKCGMISLFKSVFYILYCMSVVNKPQSNQWTVSDIQIMAIPSLRMHGLFVCRYRWAGGSYSNILLF